MCTALHVLHVPSPTIPVTKNPRSVSSAPGKLEWIQYGGRATYQEKQEQNVMVMLSDTPKKK